MLELNKIYNTNCLDGFKDIDDNSVDLIITSPPYKEEDGFGWELINQVASESYRVLKNNSLCFINFGHLANFKSRPFKVALEFEQTGFEWIDTITWVKKQYSPVQGNKRLDNLTEFIFMFAKGKPKIDRLAIGIPYDDKSNIGRYSDIDLHCGGNLWIIGYETITHKSQKLHKDRFPVELPLRCIKLANIPDQTIVLDPFAGSGTTAYASKKLNKQYIGFELLKSNVEIAENRLLDTR